MPKKLGKIKINEIIMNNLNLNTFKKWYIFCILLVFFSSYELWKFSCKPYGEKLFSPNGKFYIQKFSVITWNNFLFTPPGNSSDNIDGFIKLYNSEGKLLQENFVTGLASYEMCWSNNSVYSPRIDGIYWKLPNTR